jgi:nucleotide-binding universal stress UspA family protein
MGGKRTHEHNAAAVDCNPVSNLRHPFGVKGRRYELASEPEVRSTFRSILVDVDATAEAQHALEQGVRIAQACGARLRIVDVVPSADARSCTPGLDPYYDSTSRRRERLQQLAERAERVRGLIVDWDVLAGRVAPALVEEVQRSGHDLLIRAHWRDVVARGPREARDVDAELFRTCPCPVWAVGYGATSSYPRIVAAVDGDPREGPEDPRNAIVVEVAARIAQAERSSVTLLQAWTAFAETKVRGQAGDEDFAMYLDATRRRAERQLVTLAARSCFGVPPILVDLRRGEPGQVIPEYVVAYGVDVLVVGANKTAPATS